MGLTLGLKLVFLLAMVATNIVSLYHLSSSLQNKAYSSPSPVPDHLLHQLATIRTAISQLTGLPHMPPVASSSPPPDLLLHTRIYSIASSCRDNPDLLYRYMNYTPFVLCPNDDDLAENLTLRGCHPLPRRRCFSRTPSPSSLPTDPFPESLPNGVVDWNKYECKSFECLNRLNRDAGFDMRMEASRFKYYKTDLDLPIPQLLQLARSSGSVLRLGLDIGGGTGTFAGRMKTYNVTVLTTTMNLGKPHNEAASARGLLALHAPLQQRFPIFDGVMDLVRCGHGVNRWIPTAAMEFMFHDIDRVLRGGGYLWVDRFLSREEALRETYAPLIWKLGYTRIKWAVANKTTATTNRNGSSSSSSSSGEIYLTALLQKPVSR